MSRLQLGDSAEVLEEQPALLDSFKAEYRFVKVIKITDLKLFSHK